jgi:hypothetical protein
MTSRRLARSPLKETQGSSLQHNLIIPDLDKDPVFDLLRAGSHIEVVGKFESNLEV